MYVKRTFLAGQAYIFGGDERLGKNLHQPQRLDELAVAAIAHAGFQESPQMLERFRKCPVGARGGPSATASLDGPCARRPGTQAQAGTEERPHGARHLQREAEYIDARPHSCQIDKNLLRRTAYIGSPPMTTLPSGKEGNYEA
jgi:hypothetical protein